MKFNLKSWECFGDRIDEFTELQPIVSRPENQEDSLIGLGLLEGETSLCSDPFPCFCSEMNSGDSVANLVVQTSCQQEETQVSDRGMPTCQSIDSKLPGPAKDYQDAVSGNCKDALEDKEIVEVGTEENSAVRKKVDDYSKFLHRQKVRNMKEKKRRDKINKHMESLHKLIPHSDKSDKASILADAVEYIKFFQQKFPACGSCSEMHRHTPSAATQFLPPCQFYWPGQTASAGGIAPVGNSLLPSFVPAAPLPLFHGMPSPYNLHQDPLSQRVLQDKPQQK